MRILIVKNKYSKKLSLQKCFDWFKKNLNLDIQVDEIKTDLEVTTKKVGNATFNGVVCGNLHEILRPIIPINKYHCVVFIYGNSLDGVRLSAANITGPLDMSTDIIQLAKVDWKTLNHELFHTFFHRVQRSGHQVYDNMDSYERDTVLDLTNGQTNRTIALNTLKPYWDKVLSMPLIVPKQPVQTTLPIVTIVRSKSTKKQTLGKLTAINGTSTFSCNTLELPDLNNQKSISCIPKGTYTCRWTYSLKYPTGTYEVQSVPNRSGIRIHKGNRYDQIQGCILPGTGLADLNGDNEIDVTNSTIAFNALNSLMQKKPFTLIVK
jgi:hypothetical protein